jgi:hypothetical protein
VVLVVKFNKKLMKKFFKTLMLILIILFIICKLTNLVNFSWWWVLVPIILSDIKVSINID